MLIDLDSVAGFAEQLGKPRSFAGVEQMRPDIVAADRKPYGISGGMKDDVPKGR